MALKDGGIVILDYGSQTAQLIARRVRELGVFAVLVPYTASAADAQAAAPAFRGVILSGGPASVYEPGAPTLPDWVLAGGLPVLGICYGMQLLTQRLGGRVSGSAQREYGMATVTVSAAGGLFAGLDAQQTVWMSHGDRLERPPDGSRRHRPRRTSPTQPSPAERPLFGVQFHPEVQHTAHGRDILRNFVIGVCGAATNWTPENFIAASVESIRAQVGGERVLLGMSGGVDSSVAGELIHRAVGEQLMPVFVNHGMLRQGEADAVVALGKRLGWQSMVAVHATEEFLDALRGVSEPESKRQIIGRTFAEVFEREAGRLGALDWLAQGTIYPDVIESAGTGRPGARRIKSHHNVGGLPDRLKERLVEPLRTVQGRVRQVGVRLGIPDEIVWRQPFPGPGLGVRRSAR